jgi:hypothetical protein
MVPVTIMYAASPATMGVTMYPAAVAIDCVQLFSLIRVNPPAPPVAALTFHARNRRLRAWPSF